MLYPTELHEQGIKYLIIFVAHCQKYVSKNKLFHKTKGINSIEQQCQNNAKTVCKTRYGGIKRKNHNIMWFLADEARA